MTGRPRNPECDRAILDAALSEFADRGLDGMSVDAVAARAGVSKATIYRRFASKTELVVAASFAIADQEAPKPDTGSLRGDITVERSPFMKAARVRSATVTMRLTVLRPSGVS